MKSKFQNIILIGLGNPGSSYKFTRHNAGTLVLSHIANYFSIKWTQASFGPYTKIAHERNAYTHNTILYLPGGCMNTCGPYVKKALSEFNIKQQEQIFVVHDELSMKPGRSRVVESGLSLGGHNGLKSIESSLGGKDKFQRIKIGIGRPSSHEREDVAEYVLQNFTKEEREELKALCEVNLILPIKYGLKAEKTEHRK